MQHARQAPPGECVLRSGCGGVVAAKQRLQRPVKERAATQRRQHIVARGAHARGALRAAMRCGCSLARVAQRGVRPCAGRSELVSAKLLASLNCGS